MNCYKVNIKHLNKLYAIKIHIISSLTNNKLNGRVIINRYDSHNIHIEQNNERSINDKTILNILKCTDTIKLLNLKISIERAIESKVNNIREIINACIQL